MSDREDKFVVAGEDLTVTPPDEDVEETEEEKVALRLIGSNATREEARALLEAQLRAEEKNT